MKKPIKEEVKKEVKAVKLSDVCPACDGAGLVRPTFRNSPLCEVCNGSGVTL